VNIHHQTMVYAAAFRSPRPFFLAEVFILCFVYDF